MLGLQQKKRVWVFGVLVENANSNTVKVAKNVVLTLAGDWGRLIILENEDSMDFFGCLGKIFD